MSSVGQFPGMDVHKRMIRAPLNPLDKSTIVSIYPRGLDEFKCTIQPGRFVVPPGSFDKPSLLVVGSSSWWREIDETQPALEIPTSSIQVADSVVKDFCKGIVGCNMTDSMPGLFYIPGEQTIELLRKNYLQEFDKALSKQRKWYEILIQLGDSLWARSNGNPLAISDDMRLAARELNLQGTKDWMKDYQMVEMVRCKACGSIKNPLYPICATCHYPDPDHPLTKSLLEAKSVVPVSK